MRICICDDDHQTHTLICNLLLEKTTIKSEHQITQCFSGEELIQQYEQNKTFDLIFLDVEMSQTDGIQAAKKIREQDEKTIIVFVSSHKQYVFDTFPVGAFHYIVKPIDPEEFEDVYQRSVQKYKDLHAEIHLKWFFERYAIPIYKILYLEGAHRHVIFHTNDAIYEGVGKVSDYIGELIPHGFVQVQQSCLVNMNYIEAIRNDKMVLKNGENIWISVRNHMNTVKAFDYYLGHRKW